MFCNRYKGNGVYVIVEFLSQHPIID